MATTERQLRILVVRLGAMGDILHALPAVTALRRAHPDWFLGWAVEPRWQELLRASGEATARSTGCPLLDRVHLVSTKAWGRQPFSLSTVADIRQVRRELGSERYEVVLDLQGALRSALVGRWARPARLIGEDAPREPLARRIFGERVATTGRHVIEQALEVAGAVAGETLPYEPAALPEDERSSAWAAEIARRAGEHFVILNPGAGWGAKRWPTERYGETAAALAAKGYGVVVNAGPEEQELAAEVVTASEGKALAVTPTLSELIALTRRAALAVAGDTGPLHLACALGKPVVGIFGPTDPARNGPFGCNFRVLRHPESRRDHTRRSKPEAGLLTISADEVTASALDLLAGSRRA